MKRDDVRGLGRSMSGATFAVIGLCLTACGGSEDNGGLGGGGGTAGTSGAPTQRDVGTMFTVPTTCTEEHTICMNMVIPSTMEGQPTSVVFNLYPSAEPPATLPAGYAGRFTSPTLTPGQHMYFKLTDGGLQGDFWVWAIMYMPNGGYGAPVQGVDYGMQSDPAALHLDGSPINVDEPVVVGL